MLSLRKYITLSVLTASAVIYHAFATRRQFFPATVYLSTSKLAVAAVGNLSFAVALCAYNLVIKVFLGALREIELERVKEKLSSAIMETCLALTIFRDEFTIAFVGMFTLLTFVKVFHWLVQDRVDYIEVTPSVSRLGHARIVAFLAALLSLDVWFLHHTIAATLAQKGHGVQLLFAFEYVILASAAAATLLKYALSMLDSAMEGRWEGKGTAVFYLELLTDLLHLTVYCIFFVIVFTNYGLPLHLVRDLYMTFRNFRGRIADFLRFRQVTARMDRFPDASPADLLRCDGICIICREEMSPSGLNKKLLCGHVFHLHCLRSWLERQQNCPTCRTSVFRPPPERLQAPPRGPVAPAAAAAAAAAAGAGAAGQQAAPGGAAPAAGAPGNAGAAALEGALPPAAAGPAAPQPSAGRPPIPPAAPGVAAVAAGAGSAAGSSRAAGAGGGAAGVPPGQQGGLAPSLRPPRREPGSSSSRTRSPRTSRGSASAAAAANAEGPHGPAPAQAAPGFWPAAGAGGVGSLPGSAQLVWQVPQWYPVASMAAFSNAPLQYAGQQSALEQAQALAAASMAVPLVPAMLPAIPALSAPFPAAMLPQVAHSATPEQAQAAAAAAAMAAAASAMYLPPMMPGLAMMPPAMLPAGPSGSSAHEQVAAAAAANAAAAAAAAVLGGPEVIEATRALLQHQLDLLQSQLGALRSSSGSLASSQAAPAAAGAGPSCASSSAGAPAVAGSSTAPGAAAPAPAAAAAAGAGSEACSSAAAAAAAQAGSSMSEPAMAAAHEPAKPQAQAPPEPAAAAPDAGAGGDAEASELRRRRLQYLSQGSSAGSQQQQAGEDGAAQLS